MSEFEDNIENALKDMGVKFVDTPPAADAPTQQPQAIEPVATPTEPTPEDVGSS